MNIECYRDGRGDWRWRARAANNRTLADSSEGYEHRVDMLSALALLFGDGEGHLRIPLDYLDGEA